MASGAVGPNCPLLWGAGATSSYIIVDVLNARTVRIANDGKPPLDLRAARDARLSPSAAGYRVHATSQCVRGFTLPWAQVQNPTIPPAIYVLLYQ